MPNTNPLKHWWRVVGMITQHDYTTSVVDTIAHNKASNCFDCYDDYAKKESLVHSCSNKSIFSSKTFVVKGLHTIVRDFCKNLRVFHPMNRGLA